MNLSDFFKMASVSGFICVSMLSCMNTETLDPPAQADESSETISLFLSSPVDVTTRTEDGYVLRYTVKLLLHDNNGNKLLERKECLETGDKSQDVITFKVEPNKTYYLYCFADYIPVNSELDKDGFYKDYFYNTRMAQENVISMITNPDGGSEKISKSFFNNDYYDCFMQYIEVKKKEAQETISAILERVTAKIRFIDENLTEDNFDKLLLSNMSINISAIFETKQAQADRGTYSSKDLSHITFTEPGNIDKKELFFFYTLAYSEQSLLNNIKFSTINSEGVSLETSISSLPFQKNYITTVKGRFLSTDSGEEDPNPDGPGDEDDGEGDIIVNLDTNKNWKNPEFSVDEN